MSCALFWNCNQNIKLKLRRNSSHEDQVNKKMEKLERSTGKRRVITIYFTTPRTH